MFGKALTRPRNEFQVGEPVIVLYQGKYNGMAGTFLGIRTDPDWAGIEEPSGTVRPHPVDWIRKVEHGVKPVLTAS